MTHLSIRFLDDGAAHAMLDPGGGKLGKFGLRLGTRYFIWEEACGLSGLF